MNRKYFKPIAIAAIALIAFFALWRNMNHTSNWKSDLFALKNPNEITKFVFTPNNDKKTSLQFQKIDGVWFVINNTDRLKQFFTLNFNKLAFIWYLKC